ncbi:hypothetical protein T492DRAFT_838920 [Pavlovales sp. CCMP2436]|nr:hypothetical protein T492DRAFT_838920 [Pavlovales sp. CCMP2436]
MAAANENGGRLSLQIWQISATSISVDWVLPWAAFLLILPFRVTPGARAPIRGSRGGAERPVLQRADAIWVVRDSSAAQSLVDLLAYTLVPLLRNAPAPVVAAAHERLRVSLHVTSRRGGIASESEDVIVPPELAHILSILGGRPDFSARISAIELLTAALDPTDYREDLLTRVYYCDNASVSRELAQLAARENVVSSIAGLTHHVSSSRRELFWRVQAAPQARHDEPWRQALEQPSNCSERDLRSQPPTPKGGPDGPSSFGSSL